MSMEKTNYSRPKFLTFCDVHTTSTDFEIKGYISVCCQFTWNASMDEQRHQYDVLCTCIVISRQIKLFDVFEVVCYFIVIMC